MTRSVTLGKSNEGIVSNGRKCFKVNLRNVGDYFIGLDIGTNSVGWAVVDENGDLCKFKGQNTWGSRLFEQAKSAADTRSLRTLRRRYGRRKQRIQDLRAFLYPDIEKVDPDFFCRMAQSGLVKCDRNSGNKFTFFIGDEFNDADFYSREGGYPTIYHLRHALVCSSEKMDIRLVYLALHHMMKYRGNFLVKGEMSAADADAGAAVDNFISVLEWYFEEKGVDFLRDDIDASALILALGDSSKTRAVRRDDFVEALGLPKSEAVVAKEMARAAFGYKTNFAKIIPLEGTGDASFLLSEEAKVQAFEDEMLPEEYTDLYASLKELYGAYLLSGILSDARGETLSAAMIRRWEDHRADLAKLKGLVMRYFPKDERGVNRTYNSIFRGARYADGSYKKTKGAPHGYTSYILGSASRDEFYAELKKQIAPFAESFSEEDARFWNESLQKMEEGMFLRKLRTSENGAIPHQLHLEEMRAVIDNQKAYYPTLAEHGDEICQLLAFRLPYYVGPLGKESNPNRKKPFGWAVRKPGKESEPVRPWNFDDVIDRDACAEAFITNLTGECSYYLGKKVIPKNSLLYSEFCVRQELNVCKHDADGERFVRMNVETVQAIYDDVFKKKVRVRVSDVEEYLKSCFGSHYKIKGTQRETEFASSLRSYVDFSRILERAIETFEDYEMVENLILWVTVFEDKAILKRRINSTYGPAECGGNGALTHAQVKRVCKLRYTGWSNLSREFLEELRVDYQGRSTCIMDVLRDSDRSTPMNLMEILADERFGFKPLLDARNQEFLGDRSDDLLDDIPGSPAIKRGINQSLKIVDEIVSIVGHAPTKICVEMARDEVAKTKGKRTTTRYKQIENLYAAITKDMALYEGQKDLKSELSRYKDGLDSKRLYLYFLQRGKCAYSGEPLQIENLSLYHIDHIVPQSVVKDDSIDNMVLVKQSENERKLDEYPLPATMRSRCFARWASWHDAKLMSDKKFNALTSDRVTDRQAKGFINRQLVETRQISKHVVTLLQSIYPDSTIETVKAELSHNLRVQYGFYKVRAVNDWHHAHDAYLACQLSRFVATRFPHISEDFDYATFSRFAIATKKATKSHAGLIVNSFGINGFDPETGEVFRDSWHGEYEVGRIRKCLNYKDCFVSRKVEKLTGSFWNQTVYSRRKESDKAIPLKANLSVKSYGHYEGVSYAFYSVVEHAETVRGKKKRKVSMVGIPVNVSYRLKDEAGLRAYIESLYEDSRILRPYVMKYQKIEWSGVEYYLTSPSEMINARQLWLPRRYMKLLCDFGLKKEVADRSEELSEGADELFGYLRDAIAERYPRYGGVAEKLFSAKAESKFRAQSVIEKSQSIDEILAMLHCDGARGLGRFGLSTSAGRMMNVPIGSSVPDITFIDSSVTGMFERRSRIEL